MYGLRPLFFRKKPPEAVTKKGKRLEKVLKRMREEARKSQKNGVGCVCGTDRDLQKRIRDYYEGSAA